MLIWYSSEAGRESHLLQQDLVDSQLHCHTGWQHRREGSNSREQPDGTPKLASHICSCSWRRKQRLARPPWHSNAADRFNQALPHNPQRFLGQNAACVANRQLKIKSKLGSCEYTAAYMMHQRTAEASFGAPADFCPRAVGKPA